jgi:hypothetical protein
LKSFPVGPIALIAAMLLIVPAHATPFTNASTGLASPSVYLDFSGLSEGANIANTYSAQGIVFDGLQATSFYGNSFSPTTAPAAVNFSQDRSSIADPFTFNFTAPVTDLSFYLVTDGGGTSVTSYLAGSVVETLSIGAYNGGSSFSGFTNTLIDQVVLNVAGDRLALIDDVSFATTVPEPASVMLLCAGLIGLTATRRRRDSLSPLR